jgi:orotate phosphoribosyltransferase
VARALLDAGCVTVSPDRPVTFRSGLLSPLYVDNRRLIFQPGPWHVVVDALVAEVRRLRPAPEVVAGVESAGIPHSAALAFSARLPSVFVRKQAKEHGLGRRIEGGDVAGRRVVLVEDMVTSGGSSLSAVAALREAGARVEHCLAIVSYGFGNAAAAFVEAGVDLHVLAGIDRVIEEAETSGRLAGPALGVVRAWLRDPVGWSAP